MLVQLSDDTVNPGHLQNSYAYSPYGEASTVGPDAACKGEALARSRAALGMPAPNARALECATGFLTRVARLDAQQCSYCRTGRLRVVESLAGKKRLPEPCATVVLEGVLPRGRGPP